MGAVLARRGFTGEVEVPGLVIELGVLGPCDNGFGTASELTNDRHTANTLAERTTDGIRRHTSNISYDFANMVAISNRLLPEVRLHAEIDECGSTLSVVALSQLDADEQHPT